MPKEVKKAERNRPTARRRSAWARRPLRGTLSTPRGTRSTHRYGAVGAAFRVGEAAVAVVNVHLPAECRDVRARNAMVADALAALQPQARAPGPREYSRVPMLVPFCEYSEYPLYRYL